MTAKEQVAAAAARGKAIADMYNVESEGAEDVLTDILCDLHHWLDSLTGDEALPENTSFELIKDVATNHYFNERFELTWPKTNGAQA
jgi:hypothetical protein